MKTKIVKTTITTMNEDRVVESTSSSESFVLEADPGKVLKNISDYPEETSLQKRIKQYLLSGKTLGNGWAILK